MTLNKLDMINATVSNYIHLIIKIIVSLILIRVMFLGLDQESYGFWALLWSIFGYSVLLDFGLGVSIQKKSARLLAKNITYKVSGIFSTFFVVYTLIAMIIAITTLVLHEYLEYIFVIDNPIRLEEYKLALLVFGFGSAAAFSLGFSAEILRGLHMLRARNIINTAYILLNGLSLYLCIEYTQPLYTLAFFAVFIQFLNNLTFLILLKREIPQLKFKKSLIDLQSVKKSLHFSLSAYAIMFSNVIIFRTDQIVISVIAGVSYAGFYQVAARASELFRQFTTQFHESISTKAAMLHSVHDKKELSELMTHSNKVIATIATMLFIPMFLLIQELLYLWLNIENPEVALVAKVLLISMYVLVVFRSSMVQILIMNNKHIELMKIGIVEAISNITLSVFLVSYYGMIGAAVGTLIPNIILALIYNIPVALKYTATSIYDYTFKYIIPLFTSASISMYFGYEIKDYIQADSILNLFIISFFAVMFFSLVYVLLGFNKELKSFIKCKLSAYNYIKLLK